eukprot:TRINITY_DN3821_c0_g1_i14.p1 TRINITY_DN3821_c0_g1~~TRINITY_DN3821_c0_g1_i14.p1  ORF type:complete len:512 (+),score=94.30 TRINITY_DN3821_c0_g1_i14:65-1600(+)
MSFLDFIKADDVNSLRTNLKANYVNTFFYTDLESSLSPLARSPYSYKWRMALLHIACYFGSKNCTKCLLDEYQCDTSVKVQCLKGENRFNDYTAAQIAQERWFSEIVQMIEKTQNKDNEKIVNLEKESTREKDYVIQLTDRLNILSENQNKDKEKIVNLEKESTREKDNVIQLTDKLNKLSENQNKDKEKIVNLEKESTREKDNVIQLTNKLNKLSETVQNQNKDKEKIVNSDSVNLLTDKLSKLNETIEKFEDRVNKLEEESKKTKMKTMEEEKIEHVKMVEKLYNDEDKTDFKLNGVTMHKFVISVRCPIVLEKTTLQHQLNDVSLETIKCLKRYIYKDTIIIEAENETKMKEPHLSIEKMFELWKVARMLNMVRLEKIVRAKLRSCVDANNAVKIAVLSIQSEMKNEMKQAISIIQSNPEKYANELELYPMGCVVQILMAKESQFVEEDITIPESTFENDLKSIIKHKDNPYAMFEDCTNFEETIKRVRVLEDRMGRLQERVDNVEMH